MKKIILLLLAFLLSGLSAVTLKADDQSNTKNETNMNEEKTSDHLLIVWTSGDPDVAHNMVFMYAYNAQKNGWWDQVTLLIWGPSQTLAGEDTKIQEYLKKMQEEGVEIIACKACADKCGVSSKLVELGIEVKYTGTYLTDFIKSGKKVVTF